MTAWAMAHPWMTLWLAACAIGHTGKVAVAIVEGVAQVAGAIVKRAER